MRAACIPYMMKFIKTMVCGAVLAAVLMSASSANAITFTGSDSYGRAASATFSLRSDGLHILLANTATYDAMVPTDMLTALFFNVPTGVALTPAHAYVGANSTVIDTVTGNANYHPAGYNIGGEWAYAANLGQLGGLEGTSSTGLGLFGSGNFGGGNLQGPTSGAVDGVQYGITTAGDNVSTGNGGITSANSSQFIRYQVELILTSVPTTFDLSGISDVRFQYGTDLTEPYFVGASYTPSPPPRVPDGGSTFMLLSSALAGVGALRRKIKS